MSEIIEKVNNILKSIKELKDVMDPKDIFWLDLNKIEKKIEFYKVTLEIEQERKLSND